jgi:enamine deaminase RidA (YjgF/YER057c/UK114 family)
LKLRLAILAAALIATATLASAQTPEGGMQVKHIQTAKSYIASGVWAGDTFYLSGQTATPVTAADPVKGTLAVMGDMKTQATSVYAKIQKSLQEQGLDMKDVVKVTVFMAADPTTGKLAFAEMNGAFAQYFGTKEQPRLRPW